jgi:type IV secretion system protein VirB3
MALRTIPIRRAGNRTNLFLGCDREVIMFIGAAAAALIFMGQDTTATIYGLILWFSGLYILRVMGKSDPQMKGVWFYNITRYKGAKVHVGGGKYLPHYFPAQSTPHRINTRKPGGQS